MENPSITSLAAACIDWFARFCPTDSGTTSDLIQRVPYDKEIWAEEQLSRFNVWTANLGVFALGHASVGHRLRDHPETYNLMSQFLEALRANLQYSKISYFVQSL